MAHSLASSPTLDLLRRRRSVPPQFLTEPGPSPAELDALLAAAARVPDHGKLVPWRLIVFEGEGRVRAGAALAALVLTDDPAASAERLETERGRLAHAPLVIAVVSRAGPHIKVPEWEQVLSAGAVAMTLTIAAVALGYATSWLTEWPTYDARARTALGLADGETLAGFIHVGTPTLQPEDRVRPVMADIVTRF